MGKFHWYFLENLARIAGYSYEFRFSEDKRYADIKIKGNIGVLCCACFPCCPRWFTVPDVAWHSTSGKVPTLRMVRIGTAILDSVDKRKPSRIVSLRSSTAMAQKVLIMTGWLCRHQSKLSLRFEWPSQVAQRSQIFMIKGATNIDQSCASR